MRYQGISEPILVMHRLVLSVVVAMLAASAAAAEERTRVAVLNLRADTELDKGTLNTLDEILLSSFHKSGCFEVLGMADIASMLTLEEERAKLSGCVDDSCLAEIGGALGVELIVGSSVGRLGDHYFVSVKLLDVKRARVVDRCTLEIEQDELELVEAIRRAVDEIAGRASSLDLSGATAGNGDAPPGALDCAAWISLGLTAAAGATAGVLGGLALADKRALEDRTRGNDDWAELQDARESKALAADVLFGVAGAAAVATVVLFVVGALDEGEPAAAAAVTPVPGGAAASLVLRFR